MTVGGFYAVVASAAATAGVSSSQRPASPPARVGAGGGLTLGLLGWERDGGINRVKIFVVVYIFLRARK